MNVKEFRKILKSEKAGWSLPNDIPDETDLAELARPFPSVP